MENQVIRTSNGESILVDAADFAWLSQWQWCVGTHGYAIRSERLPDGRQRHVLMHRQLLGLSHGEATVSDHKNGNRLDNRRENLRRATHLQNHYNVLRKPGSSGAQGVYWRGHSWQAKIKCDGRHRHLGMFATMEEAAEFRQLAADMIHGEFVRRP
jgi:HNH endonuclease